MTNSLDFTAYIITKYDKNETMISKKKKLYKVNNTSEGDSRKGIFTGRDNI